MFDTHDYMKRVLVPAAEAFSSAGQLPDIFMRYDLPLDAYHQADIEARIRTVHGFWNKTKTNPKYRSLLERLLSEVELRASRALLDDEARSLARGVVREERKRRAEAQFTDLDRTIRMISGKGYITPEERTMLVTRYKSDVITETDIRARVKVPEKAAPILLPEEKDALPLTTRKQIRNNLAVLSKRDLYEFLDLASPSPKAEVTARWQRKNAEVQVGGADFRKTAAQELLGIIKTHLIDGDPARYETSRRWEIIERLDRDIETAGADRHIDREEFKTLLASALSYGLTEETARDYIRGLAQRRNLGIDVPPAEGAIRCAGCHAMQPGMERDRCSSCGAPLWLDCPSCRRRVAASEAACGACGFFLANHQIAKLEMRQAQLAINERRWGDALAAAREVVRLGWLEREAKGLRDHAEAELRGLEEARQRIDAELVAKRLHAALKQAEDLKRRAGGHRFRDGSTAADLRATISTLLAGAAQHVVQARTHELAGRLREAVFSYQAALAVAVDDDDAQKGLERCPPEPPTGARAVLTGARVEVQWSRSPAHGDIQYLVVRGAGRAPLTPADGQQVARTTNLACPDDGAKSGSFVFYSVFTDRSGVLSPPAKSEGLLVTQEVRDLVVEADEGIVRGTFGFDGAARVRVWRKERATPMCLGDGIEIPLNGPGTFLDRDLINGCIYYYRVVVEYISPSGSLVFTPGIVASAQPAELPAAVDALEFRWAPPSLHIQYSVPTRGAVSVYRTAGEPPWLVGTKVPISELVRLGKLLPMVRADCAADPSPPTGRALYVAATVVGDIAVIGAARALVSIQDVSQVTAESFGAYILVRWRWPDGCSIARVTWRFDTSPTAPDDRGAEGRTITRGEYEIEGGFRIEEPRGQRHHIAVFAGIQVGGNTSFSAGLAADTRALVEPQAFKVLYAVSKSFFGRKLKLTFTAGEEVELPPIIVAARSDGFQPIPTNYGAVLAVLHVRLRPRIPAEFEVSLRDVRRPLFVRALFQDPAAARSYELVGPSAKSLEVL